MKRKELDDYVYNIGTMINYDVFHQWLNYYKLALGVPLTTKVDLVTVVDKKHRRRQSMTIKKG